MSITRDNSSQLTKILSTTESPPPKCLFADIEDDSLNDDAIIRPKCNNIPININD